MRYLFSLISCFFIFALASCDVAPWSYDIGDGLVLEQTPNRFGTITETSRCEQLLNETEQDVIFATSETITETVILQEGSFEVAVMPIKYNKNGSVKTAAKVRLRRIPSISKQVTYSVVKTPSGEVQIKSSGRCKPISRRIITTPATYKIKDKSGVTIKDFETAEALAEYINFK